MKRVKRNISIDLHEKSAGHLICNFNFLFGFKHKSFTILLLLRSCISNYFIPVSHRFLTLVLPLDLSQSSFHTQSLESKFSLFFQCYFKIIKKRISLFTYTKTKHGRKHISMK